LITSLPDVNVLLALAAEAHEQQQIARKWLATREPNSVAVCRVTQMGMLRLVTNPKVLGPRTRSVRSAWEVSERLLADHRVFFAYDPPFLQNVWIDMMNHPTAGPSSWTDAYLAAFAKQHDYEMVTFDKGFRRWNNLKLNLLPGT
jgi:toxin-antitoxin system PIN domain toxin